MEHEAITVPGLTLIVKCLNWQSKRLIFEHVYYLLGVTYIILRVLVTVQGIPEVSGSFLSEASAEDAIGQVATKTCHHMSGPEDV